MPRWSEDGSKIVVLKSTRQGKTISVVDAESGAGEDIVPVTQENIGHPVWADKYIFFNSPISGIDNIYAISLETKQRYQVTTSKYGAYNPSIL
jgi:Tol biopolymer transport system component